MMEDIVVPISERVKPKRFQGPKFFRSGKYANGREVYHIRFFKVRIGKHEFTMAWRTIPAYLWDLKTWICFGMFGFHSFEFKCWFITVLGLNVSYNLDCSDQIPENLRGFVASRDTLNKIEESL